MSEILAIASAFCIALSSMIISGLKGRVAVLQLARWQLVAAFAMTGLVSLVLGSWSAITLSQFRDLAWSSLFGIMIASSTYYATIYLIGPRITALLFSMASPFSLGLGYAVLDETVSIAQGLGVALVLAGIIMAVAFAPPDGREGASPVSPALLWAGIGLGLVTALGQALGSLFARPVMAAGVEPFAAMAVRSGLGMVFFLAISLLPIGRRMVVPPTWHTLGLATLASFFGTALGMALLMAALTNGHVGIVSTLSSMTPILILPMIWLKTRILPTPFAWAGAGLAMAGTALISLG